MKEWRDNFLAFIAIITELLLGTLLFFIIIFLAHYLELAIARLDDPQGSIIYWVSKGGVIFLLLAECVIGFFFVTRGIRNAWLATWGPRDEG
jgi:hypothetical protein